MCIRDSIVDVEASSEQGDDPAAPRVHRQSFNHRHHKGAPVSAVPFHGDHTPSVRRHRGCGAGTRADCSDSPADPGAALAGGAPPALLRGAVRRRRHRRWPPCASYRPGCCRALVAGRPPSRSSSAVAANVVVGRRASGRTRSRYSLGSSSSTFFGSIVSMTAPGTQVNVRLTADELELLDRLRRTSDGEMSRAALLRSLLRDKRRTALDMRIAEAYDAAPGGDDQLAEASANAAGAALADL